MTLKKQADALGIKVDGRWGSDRIKAEIEAHEKPTGPVREDRDHLARRIWEGQSVSLPRNERVRRIMAALTQKDYTTEGLELPE